MTSHAANLQNALDYALTQTGLGAPPLCTFNAPTLTTFKGDNFSYKTKSDLNTLSANYNTTIVFPTRQPDETLGLLALAAARTAPTGHIIITQDNKLGADSLEKRIKQGFANITTFTKHKCRTWVLKRADLNEAVMQTWVKNATIQPIMGGALISAPGLFSWDRPDTASRLLIEHLPSDLSGIGADFGCGFGFLSVHLAQNPNIKTLYSIDLDARAVECCAQNVGSHNPSFTHQALQHDALSFKPTEALDFIVMNPPFHTQTDEDHALGQKFCEHALTLLKRRGDLYVVANRHLPYETVLKKGSSSVTLVADRAGFKVLRATK